MDASPSVSRALLLTDVVDSTAVHQRLGDERAAALWAEHDRAARELLQQWQGREIDKTDGMLLLFEQAEDALAYAQAYHAALARWAPQLMARAGLHVGEVTLRANAPADVARGAKPLEVDGLAKAVAARVMALARGGQTLLSAAAAQSLLRGRPARLASHGHWRLKGVAEPQEVFELQIGNDPPAPPADQAKAWRVQRQGELWLPVRRVRHSLPAERDAFVGRSDALARLAGAFEGGARLINLLGLGGVGKSRMATRFAWQWLGDYAGGAWFCDISAARDEDSIVRAVAEGLNLQLGSADPLHQVTAALASRGECLVVLDNFEQVARHAEATLGHWLAKSPKVRFLVTSREVLGVPGETVQALAPLGEDDSLALFLHRARAALHGFAPNEDERDDLLRLMQLLEGLPLAIELAAARVRLLSPRALLLRMHERFRLLTSKGGRVDRQATLRAVFDWSWDLLSEPERSALAQLAVFKGGFSVEAADAVVAPGAEGGADAPWMIDLLQSLLDKSLLRHGRHGRFELLGSLQEYAHERLHAMGAPAWAAALRRHASYFASLSELQARAHGGIELENLEAASWRAAELGDAGLAVQALGAAWCAISLRGPYQGGIDLAERLSMALELDDAQRTQVLLVRGSAWVKMGDHLRAQESLLSAYVLAQPNSWLQGKLLALLAKLDGDAGRHVEARQRLAEALILAQLHANARLHCEVLLERGNINDVSGQPVLARRDYDEALVLAREHGLRDMEGALLGNLGTLCSLQGLQQEGLALHEAALGMARELGDRRLQGNALSNMGALLLEINRLPQAQQVLQEALQVAHDLGHLRLAAMAHCNLALVHEGSGEWALADAEHRQAILQAQAVGDRHSEGLFTYYLGRMLLRQGRAGEALPLIERSRTHLNEAQDRYSQALADAALAVAHQRLGQTEPARAALFQAREAAAALGATGESELGLALSEALQAA